MIQLDFFESPEQSEMKDMRDKIRGIHQSTEKVRKALFAKHGEVYKLVMDIDSRLQAIERGLCKSQSLQHIL